MTNRFNVSQLCFDSLVSGLWHDDSNLLGSDPSDQDSPIHRDDSSLSRDCLALSLSWTPAFGDD